MSGFLKVWSPFSPKISAGNVKSYASWGKWYFCFFFTRSACKLESHAFWKFYLIFFRKHLREIIRLTFSVKFDLFLLFRKMSAWILRSHTFWNFHLMLFPMYLLESLGLELWKNLILFFFSFFGKCRHESLDLTLTESLMPFFFRKYLQKKLSLTLSGKVDPILFSENVCMEA